MTLRVAEFNNRTMYRACAFVTAPLAIKPATARTIEGRAPPRTAHAPVLAPGRAAGKLALDDACLERYLAAAKWSLDFPDRPVVDAIGATAAWRASTVERARPTRYGSSRSGGASSGVQASKQDGKKLFWYCTRDMRSTPRYLISSK